MRLPADFLKGIFRCAQELRQARARREKRNRMECARHRWISIPGLFRVKALQNIEIIDEH